MVTHVVLDTISCRRPEQKKYCWRTRNRTCLERGVVEVQDAGDVHGALTVDDRVGEAPGVEAS